MAFGGSLAGAARVVLGVDTRDFNRDMQQAESRFRTSTRNMDRDVGALGQGVDRSSKAFVGFGRSVIAASGVFLGATGFVALMRQTVSVAADFEQQMNVLQAVTKGTATQMKAAAAEARKLGADTRLPATSARDAAAAMTELSKAGLTIPQAMKAARGTLQLAAAAQIEEAEAAQITARALNAFGLEGERATEVADLLANAANAASGEIGDFAIGLQQSSAVANQFGLTAGDTVTALAELANAGIVGSDAGTSLRVMLQRLVPQTKNAREEMAQLGIAWKDTNGNLLPLRTNIEQYDRALSKLTPAQRQQSLQIIFGTDAQRAANIIMQGGVEKYDALRSAVEKQGGAAKFAAAQNKGFNGAMDALRSAIETMQISIGEGLLPIFSRWARSLANNKDAQKRLVDGAKDAVDAIGNLAKSADTVAGAIGGWRSSLELLFALNVVTKIGAMTTAFTALAGSTAAASTTGAASGLAGAAGKAGLLLRTLKLIGAVSAVKVAINFASGDADLPTARDYAGRGLLGSAVLALLGEKELAAQLAQIGAKTGGTSAPDPRQPPSSTGQATPSGAGANFIYPKGTKYTVGGAPGQGTHAQKDWQSGNAIDIFASAGTPVLSPVDGTIVKVSGSDPARGTVSVGTKKIYGYGVTIQGYGGMTYYLAHLDAVSVTAGQKVRRGQVIGKVATWGGGPAHVHIGVPWGQDPKAITLAGQGTLAGGGAGTGTGGGPTPDPDRDPPGGEPPPPPPSIPLQLQEKLLRAQDTKKLSDDLAVLQEIDRLLTKKINAERDIKKRIDLLEERKGIRGQIAGITKQPTKRARAAEDDPILAGLYLREARAADTKRLDDDLKALEAIEAHLTKRIAVEKKVAEKTALIRERQGIRGRITDAETAIRDARPLPPPVRIPGLDTVLGEAGRLGAGAGFRDLGGKLGKVLVPHSLQPTHEMWQKMIGQLRKKLAAALGRRRVLASALQRLGRIRGRLRDPRLIQWHQQQIRALDGTIAEIRSAIGEAFAAQADIAAEAASKAQQDAEEAERLAQRAADEATDLAATQAREAEQAEAAYQQSLVALPADIRYAAALAGGTADTADDIAALQREESFLAGNLGRGTLETEIQIVTALNSVRAQIARLEEEQKRTTGATLTLVDIERNRESFLQGLRSLRGDQSNIFNPLAELHGGRTIKVENYFQQGPIDAHLWSRDLEFELRTLVA